MGTLSVFRTSDLRELLNSYKGAIAAVKFVLQTNLLAQFSLVAASEQAHRQSNATLEESVLIDSNGDEEDGNESESDIPQSDSRNADNSQADRTPLV